MIELGRIRLRHRSSVYDARKKIRGLADALGYDPILATRLATAVSEATRVLLRSGREPRIAVALAMKLSPPRLLLDFAYDALLRGLAHFQAPTGQLPLVALVQRQQNMTLRGHHTLDRHRPSLVTHDL